MKSIEILPKTTFSGRRFTRKQLEQIQDTVSTFKNLSRKELAKTLCEHLSWITPNGSYKFHSCLTLLQELEEHGIVTLPAKRQTRRPVHRQAILEDSQEDQPINETLAAISPIELQLVTSKEDRYCWKAYLQAYHYLGYKHAFGSHLCYFIVSQALRQKIGCLLFSASAAWALAPRDNWIGWEKKHKQKLLHLIISQSRFLIFPWVKVPNLATKVLSKSIRQIGDDWLRIYGYRPVLIETFVDTTKYYGTCYGAANWQYLGKTTGRGRFHKDKQTIKDIFVYPLQSDWRDILTNYHRISSLKKKYRNDLQSSNTRSVDESFVLLWEKVIQVISDVASQYDKKWQVRKRLINSMLLILLIFRLVCSKNSQSYGTTIDEMWDNCDRLNLPLPQKSSIAPSCFCEARKKLDEDIFKYLNQRIIATYAQQDQDESYRWLGHRLFAVDGSKINLPRKLISYGYKLPSENANYPQGLLSSLYQLKSQIPFDFDLVNHGNERLCAQNHLQTLEQNDVVVYDRGYFSYVMLHQHYKSGIHAIFRLQESSFTVIKNFFSSEQKDIIETIYPSRKTRHEIMISHPEINIVPLQMRLIKYQISGNTYCLGITLLDQNKYNSIQAFIDIYHARWGVEELYKVSKRIFIIEDFHAKSERGVKQELFAHFVLITMNRIFANQADFDLNQHENLINSIKNQTNLEQASSKVSTARVKVNFKNCIHVFTRSIEELLLLEVKVKTVIEKTFRFIAGQYQKVRPGRSYVRKSMKPESKWRPKKNEKKKQSSTVAKEAM